MLITLRCFTHRTETIKIKFLACRLGLEIRVIKREYKQTMEARKQDI